MKKFVKSLFMAAVLIAVLLCCACLQYKASEKLKKEEQVVHKVENPFPPDRDKLKNQGILPFQSELPVMMIHTGGQQFMKEQEIDVTITILDDDSGKNDIFAQADAVIPARAKYRGASSYETFDKHQYRVSFVKQNRKKTEPYPLFGMGADSSWVLHGPFLDRSLMRNALMYQLSAEMMEYAPDYRYFELFVEGEYQGVYLAVEPITAGPERLNLAQYGLTSGATPYVVRRERPGTEKNVLHTLGESCISNELCINYPTEKKLTQRQYNWIENDVNNFEKALYGDKFADPVKGYAAYIDVENFADYLILGEFSMNHDVGLLSTVCYKDFDEKIKTCVWDHNNAFDNFPGDAKEISEFHCAQNGWLGRLVQDRAFVDCVISRYAQLRKTVLSDKHIEECMNSYRQEMGLAVNRNFKVWGYTLQRTLLSRDKYGNTRDPKSYDEAVSRLKTTIRNRLIFMDNHLDRLYDYCIN